MPLPRGSESAVVSGYLCIQVLAHNQPASATEFRRVFVVDEEEIKEELIALMRGAGVVRDGNVVDDEKVVEEKKNRKEIEGDDRVYPTRAKIEGFMNAASFTRFTKDLAWLCEAHWRSRLYTPSAREASRSLVKAFKVIVNKADVPALSSLLEEIAADVDDQEEYEIGSLSEAPECADDVETTDAAAAAAKAPAVPVVARKPSGVDHAAAAHAAAADAAANHAIGAVAKHTIFPEHDVGELANVMLPMTTEQWVLFHQAGALITFFSIAISVIKAEQWGISSPATVAIVQIPAFAWALVMSLSIKVESIHRWAARQFDRKSPTARWLRLRFDQGIILTVCSQNAVISTLFPHDAAAMKTKWIIATMCNVCNMCFLAHGRGELAHYHSVRFDLFLQSALTMAIWHAAQVAAHGDARFLTSVAFSSVYHMMFWLWFTPFAIATYSRNYYRTEIRVAHRLSAANKAKKLA
jgi:hypothetical protein